MKMDYETVFKESYTRVLTKKISNKGFFEEFYDKFAASSEEVAKKFKDVDMEKQRKVVRDSLHHMLNCYLEREINDEIIRLAVQHNKANLDIRPELYDLWLEALIETVIKFDEEFDKYIELAWRIVLSIGITYMKFRHNTLLYKFY